MAQNRMEAGAWRRRTGMLVTIAVFCGVCNLHQAYSSPFNEGKKIVNKKTSKHLHREFRDESKGLLLLELEICE